MKSIAIIGAGFCGLALAYHLLNTNSHNITLYDRHGIASGASGVSAGLLHPFAGAQAKLNRMGREGVAATQELLNIAGPDVILSKGLLRLAYSDRQKEDFSRAATHYPGLQWWEPDRTQKVAPGSTPAPGLWIEEALCIDSKQYLYRLWDYCSQKGVRFVQEEVELGALDRYDYVIVAIGAEAKKWLPDVRITPVKGQILEIAWPQEVPLFAYPISSEIYLIRKTPEFVLAGATFEKNFPDAFADEKTAISLLLPKIQTIYPMIDHTHIVGCSAGIRASAKAHLPAILRLDQRTWFLTGMGSKGLLYHALYAKNLVEQL